MRLNMQKAFYSKTTQNERGTNMKNIFLKSLIAIILTVLLIFSASACVFIPQDDIPDDQPIHTNVPDDPEKDNDTTDKTPDDTQENIPADGDENQENNGDSTETEEDDIVVVTPVEKPEILTADTEDLWQKGKDIWDSLELGIFNGRKHEYIDVIPLQTPSHKTDVMHFNWTYCFNQWQSADIEEGDFVLIGNYPFDDMEFMIAYIIASTANGYEIISFRETTITNTRESNAGVRFNWIKTSGDIRHIDSLLLEYINTISLTDAVFSSPTELSVNDVALIVLYDNYSRHKYSYSTQARHRELHIFDDEEYSLCAISVDTIKEHISSTYPGSPTNIEQAAADEILTVSKIGDWYVYSLKEQEYPISYIDEIIIDGNLLYVTDCEIETTHDKYVYRYYKYTFEVDIEKESIKVLAREFISENVEDKSIYPPKAPNAPDIEGYTYLGGYDSMFYRSETTGSVYEINGFNLRTKEILPFDEIPKLEATDLNLGKISQRGRENAHIDISVEIEFLPDEHYCISYDDPYSDVAFKSYKNWIVQYGIQEEYVKGKIIFSLKDEYKHKNATVTVYNFYGADIIKGQLYSQTISRDTVMEIPLYCDDDHTNDFIITVEFEDSEISSHVILDIYFDNDLSLLVDKDLGAWPRINRETGELIY